MATQLGQQINLQNAGLISAAGRRLSGAQGMLGMEGEEDEQSGATQGLNPFQGYALAANVAPQQQSPAPQLKGFSFNPKYSNIAAGYDRDVADAGLRRNNSIFQANDIYNTQLGEGNRLQQEAIRKLSERLMVRGLGNSSIMLNERGNQEQNFQRYVDNLGRIRANQLAGAETDYGSAIENVNRAREGLFFQQGQEEEQLARERAAQEAARVQREQELAAQREYQNWMMQQQQAAMQAQQEFAASQAAAQRAWASSIGAGGGGVGAGGGGGGGQPQGPLYGLENGQMVGENAFLQAIAMSPNQAWLNMLWDSPNQQGLPSHIRQAVLSRIAANRGWGGGSLAAL